MPEPAAWILLIVFSGLGVIWGLRRALARDY